MIMTTAPNSSTWAEGGVKEEYGRIWGEEEEEWCDPVSKKSHHMKRGSVWKGFEFFKSPDQKYYIAWFIRLIRKSEYRWPR